MKKSLKNGLENDKNIPFKIVTKEIKISDFVSKTLWKKERNSPNIGFLRNDFIPKIPFYEDACELAVGRLLNYLARRKRFVLKNRLPTARF